jgi:hypothetical protein
MRPLIPPVCLTEGGFPLANFKLAFTIECATQRESRRGDEHDEIRDNCSDGFGVDCHRKCARTDGGPGSQRPEQQTCVFAGESYSDGAEFCVTSHDGLQCGNGKWSRDTQLDCGGQNTMMQQGGDDGHMMPDHMTGHMMQDHMMPHQ